MLQWVCLGVACGGGKPEVLLTVLCCPEVLQLSGACAYLCNIQLANQNQAQHDVVVAAQNARKRGWARRRDKWQHQQGSGK